MTKIWYQSAAEMGRSGKYSEQLQAHFKRVVDPGTEVHLHGVPAGGWGGKLPSENLRYPAIFHAVLAPVFIGNAIKAEREGYDAFHIGTYLDAFLTEIRSAVDIPVSSHIETSLLMACALGQTISVITLNRQILRIIKQSIARHRLEGRMGLCIPIDPDYTEKQPVAAFEDPKEYVEKFMGLARRCVKEGADVIIPMEGIAAEVLATSGIKEVDGAVILDGIGAPVMYAEMQAKLWKRTGTRVGRAWAYERADQATMLHYYPKK
jgi:allantoin racemase